VHESEKREVEEDFRKRNFVIDVDIKVHGQQPQSSLIERLQSGKHEKID